MSCYLRHMKDILTEAGFAVTASNKKQIDKLLHEMVGATYKDCPATWQGLKQDFMSNDLKRRDLISSSCNQVTKQQLCNSQPFCTLRIWCLTCRVTDYCVL